jgi:hypothetical protein
MRSRKELNTNIVKVPDRMTAKEKVKGLPFPSKLYQMLEDADTKGFRHIVSWSPKGTAFIVNDRAALTQRIIPLYFNQTKYKSFQRQLCLYGFDRIASGKDKGGRFHKNFMRGAKHLCRDLKYIGNKRSNTGISEETGQGGLKERLVAKNNPLSITVQTRKERTSPIEFLVPPIALVTPTKGAKKLYTGESATNVVSPVIESISIALDPSGHLGYFEGMRFYLVPPAQGNHV